MVIIVAMIEAIGDLTATKLDSCSLITICIQPVIIDIIMNTMHNDYVEQCQTLSESSAISYYTSTCMPDIASYCLNFLNHGNHL